MTAPFAAFETATATSAVASLANVEATIGAATVRGIFDAAYGEGFGMVGGSTPAITCATAEVSSVVEGTAITINSVAYTARAVEPDGTGITLIRLEKAS